MGKRHPSSVTERHNVVVVGGGPVGLFLGLSLAEKGLRTVVLEAERGINPSPRALMYYPIVLHEFQKLGLLDEVVNAGYKNNEGLCFRTPAGGTNRVLAKIPPGTASSGSINYGVQLGQPRLAAILRKRAEQQPKLTLRYATRFVSLHEEADHVVVEAEEASTDPDAADNDAGAPPTKVFYAGTFVAGCDGASSPVRHALGVPFDGFTWQDWRFLAINLRYDFAAYGYPAANHVLDPTDWAVIARAGHPSEGLWRVATGIDPKVPVEEIEMHLPAKLEKLLPGPRPLKYEIVACSPYWAHERVAKRFRSGRVVLCGDAAHVNNPLTALGLTTGLVDASALARLMPHAVAGDRKGGNWAVHLDRYASIRRYNFVHRVQKQAIEGKLRIHSTDPKVVATRDDFFNMLNKNPGFGRFIASTMMETLPDDLSSPSPMTWLTSSVMNALRTMRIILFIIFWKIRASVT